MITNIRYIIITAIRDSIFIGLLLSTIFAVIVSSILGGTAMLESEEMKIVFAGASSRVILMLGLTVFVAFHVRHAFDQKEIDVFISRPISRFKIMLSYWIGFSVVACLLAIATVAILSFLQIGSMFGFLCWGVSLLLESCLMVAIVLFASFTLKSSVASVMTSVGIYVAGRMMAFFLATSESNILFRDEWINEILRMIINITSSIIPRLDIFTQSDWLVYGVGQTADIGMAVLQAIIYIPLLIAAATIDFKKKEF